jgi:hypothetical protein
MQRHLIFFDCESEKTQKTHTQTTQKLKMGWVLYYDKKTKREEKKEFTIKEDFWGFIEKYLNYSPIIFAHNTKFDLKMVDGFNQLTKNGYTIKKFYNKGKVFLLHAIKNGKTLKFWDTGNYFQSKLKDIGHDIGIEKMEIDFEKCTKKELSEYCLNDVKICQGAVETLMDFLQEYQLSILKPTAASLSLNCFRHAFYNPEKQPIYIHAHEKAISLERQSYKGGITDCFKIGRFKAPIAKLDKNSMYPSTMLNKMPVKLIYYKEDGLHLYEILNDEIEKKENHIIAEVEITLSKEKAYILTSIGKGKRGFIYGTFIESLTTPELEWVKKHGSINKCFKIALYEKQDIFTKYVDFFYAKKTEWKNEKPAFCMIAKLFLNSLYGKFGQRGSEYEELNFKPPIFDENTEGFENRRMYMVLDGDVVSINYLRIGEKYMIVKKTNASSYDSFVAISSMITGYARIQMADLILKVGRENLLYMDTDSLMIYADSMSLLKDEIDDKQIGKLKFEGIIEDSVIIRPKWYMDGEKITCKGLKKDAVIVFEDNKELWILQDQWDGMAKHLNESNLQYVDTILKIFSKQYDKGHVIDGIVHPFSADEIALLPKLEAVT